MGSFGTIALQANWQMLERCAPGHTRQMRTHHWVIRFNGKTYPTLPLGPHGKRENPEIQIGHVRKLARHLGILECAKSVLEQLR